METATIGHLLFDTNVLNLFTNIYLTIKLSRSALEKMATRIFGLFFVLTFIGELNLSILYATKNVISSDLSLNLLITILLQIGSWLAIVKLDLMFAYF